MNSFVLTLQIADDQQSRMEAMRRQHFPEPLNRVPAHITLFHTLPASHADAIAAELAGTAASCAEFSMDVTGLRHLGRGVAYLLRSPELQALHTVLADAFADDLTPQDRQRFSPHIVIQNKAEPARSQALYRELSTGFTPFTLTATGLLLWHYLDGPWRLAASYPFHRPSA